MTVLDGMCALLNDVRAKDYYEINIRRMIPHGIAHRLDDADFIIVYNRQCRLPESADPSKTYFGDVDLPNGSYELHRGLKGGDSLVVPKTAPKKKLHIVPFNDDAVFSLKVSYKASELLPEHQNGEYVTQLMTSGIVTFKEATMSGNTQYCVYADDVWCGVVFDDQTNGWVIRKEIVKTLMGKEYSFVGIPETGVKSNTNSFTTSTGKVRTAQVLNFKLAESYPVSVQGVESLPVAV